MKTEEPLKVLLHSKFLTKSQMYGESNSDCKKPSTNFSGQTTFKVFNQKRETRRQSNGKSDYSGVQ